MTSLITVAEAKAQLRCGETFIREQIARGLLPVVRLSPRALRLRQTDIDAWIADHVEGGPQTESAAVRWTPTVAHIGDDQRHGRRRRRAS